VSSRPPDALSFAVDSALIASISGEAVGWQNLQTNLVPGRHTLTWTYTKGPVDIPTGVPFADSGWVDQVSLTSTNPVPSAPSLSIELTSTNTALVSWPLTSVAFTLQQNADLQTSVWATVTNPVTVSAEENQVIITPGSDLQFYRLKYP
jgi:hypothetical protein